MEWVAERLIRMFSTSNENGAVAIDAPISGLDHVIIAVHDLDAEHARAVKLGFTTTEITPHVGWGTANTCIMFPGLDDQGDYVEILGIRDPNIGTNGLAEHLEALGKGMLSLALKGSAEKAADAFAAHSVEHFGIEALHRDVQVTPGAPKRASFKLLRPKSGAFTPIPAFVCEHLNPDVVWAERFLSHANGAIGIQAVQIMLTHDQKIGAGYEALISGAFSGSAKGPVGADLEFYSVESWSRIYGESEASEAVVYRVADLNQTGEFLRQSGLNYREATFGNRGYIVSPQDASGVYAVFTDGN